MTGNRLSALNDLELISRYKETADREAVGVLFSRYLSQVTGVCMKYLRDRDAAEDAAMQIFEKLFSDLQRFTITYFKAWLHQNTKNYCLMQLRKKKPEIRNTDLLSVESESEEHPGGSAILHELELQALELAVTKLEEHQKRCIDLFYLQNKSYQQVADATGFTMNQVKSYIQNGKRNLRIILTANAQR